MTIKKHLALKSRPILVATILLGSAFFLPQTTQANQVEPKSNATVAPIVQETSPSKQGSLTDKPSDSQLILTSPNNSPREASLTKASDATSPSKENLSSPKPANIVSLNSSQVQAKTQISIEDFRKASASQQAQWVRSQQITGDQLLTYALETIKATNPDLNNVISLREAAARQESAAMTDTGQPFYKVPILVKGLGHTIAGGQNTSGLSFMAGQTSKGTSSFVKALQSAGFVVIGQSAFPEMGWINVTNSDLYGNSHNPWNINNNPGGSSGGSAAAVASGQVALASASDGGGSTRIPASWTGLIGLHPTRGILEANSSASTNNVSHFALTKTMEDTQKLFEFLLKDQAKASQTSQHLSKDMPIAYSTKTPAGTPISDEAIRAVKEAVAFLNKEGFKTVEVNYPVDGKKMMEAYYTIAAKGALTIDFLATQKLGRHLQKEDVEPLSWALYQTGKDLTKADLDAAWAQVGQMTEDLNNFYKKYPIFLSPTTAYSAPSADYHHIPENLKPILADMSSYSKEEKLNLIYQQWLPAWTLTPFTQLANLTGTPSLSLPTHLTKDGLPLGILFNSAANQDRLLLELGKLFEDKQLFQTFWSHQVVQTPKELTDAKISDHLISPAMIQVSPSQKIQTLAATRTSTPSTSKKKPLEATAFFLPSTGQKESSLQLAGISLFLGSIALGSLASKEKKN
ncbi:amidase family protein [Streptococcus catagoni]|uniref:amidase family protein n=1 Tax=Streptococcus catagoni TaxID=2654874 RepID=UPI0014089C12|nr:amidase family protein [Streptococcus catagoni]